MLDWALTRLCGGIPRGVLVVGVCLTRREQELLTHAHSGDDVPFVHRTEPDDVHQLVGMMQEYGVSRIIDVKLYHAVAPISALLRTTLQLHDAVAATITEVSTKAFPASMFVIDTEALQDLSASGVPPDHVTLGEAVNWFRSRQQDPTRAAVSSRWLQLEMADILGIPKERWPVTICLENAAHVEILREMLENPSGTDPDPEHFIDAWKRAAISVQRAERLRRRQPLGERSLRMAVNRRRSRVLYVSVSSYFHGAAQSLCHLIDGLDRERYELFAVVSFEGALTDELRRRHVHVSCPNRTLKATDASSLTFALELVRNIAPDLAHCNHDIGLPLMCALAAAGVPIVQHVRMLAVAGLALEIQHATRLIAVSELVKTRLASLEVDMDVVDVICDGVDMRVFHPAPGRKSAARRALGIPEDAFVVASIGRMARQKRHETVVSAVAQLRRETGRGHLLLVASQDGERAYYEDIAALIRREGLGVHRTHIEFTDDVATVVHACDSLALMSRDEALGRVALEAMAVGRPVVAGDSSGVVELIEHGINGFVVPYQSTATLTSVLARLSADPIKAEAIGAAAASTIERFASAAQCGVRTMEIYDHVLAERSAALGSISGQANTSPPQ